MVTGFDLGTPASQLRDPWNTNDMQLQSGIASPLPSGFGGRSFSVPPLTAEPIRRNASPQQNFRSAPMNSSMLLPTSVSGMGVSPSASLLTPMEVAANAFALPSRLIDPSIMANAFHNSVMSPMARVPPFVTAEDSATSGLVPSFSPSPSFSPMVEAQSFSPMPEMQNALLPNVEKPVLNNGPAEVTVVEKVVEQHGMTAQEIRVVLQGERARISAAMQEIVAEQSQSFMAHVRGETQKVANMVSSLSSLSSERLTELEAKRSSRTGIIQEVVRDFDGLQLQLADLEQFRVKSTSSFDQVFREREEVMSLIDSVTQDVRNQKSIVLSGLATQSDQQQKTEIVLEGIRKDLETVISETSNLRVETIQSGQKDILAMQREQQQKVDLVISELRRQMQQSIEVVRSEASNELQMLKQSTLMGLVERVRALENNHTEQDIKDLARMVQAERSARCELTQTFEAFRVANAQTCSRLQEDANALPEKMSRIARTIAEDTSMRERIVDLEQNLTGLSGMITRQSVGAERQTDIIRGIDQQVQELWNSMKAEQIAHTELSQIFEVERQTQIKSGSDLRAEMQRVMDRLVETVKAPAEDRYARDCCVKVEQGLNDFRTGWTHKISELRTGASNDTDELRRSLQAEGMARRELAQAVDAYRISHLQTSTDLRGDIDRVFEKFNRFESLANVQDKGDLGAEVQKCLERINRLESRTDRLPSMDLRGDMDKALERNVDLRSDVDKAFERLNRLESDNLQVTAASRSQATGSAFLRSAPEGSPMTSDDGSTGFLLRRAAEGNTMKGFVTDGGGMVTRSVICDVSTAVGSWNSDDRGAGSLGFISPPQISGMAKLVSDRALQSEESVLTVAGGTDTPNTQTKMTTTAYLAAA